MIGFQTSINNSLSLLEELEFAIEQKSDFFDIFFDQWLHSAITTEEWNLIYELQAKDFSFTLHLPIEYHLLTETEKEELIDCIKTLKPKTITIHFDKITTEELEYLYKNVAEYTKISIENTIPDTECKKYLQFLQNAKTICTIYATLDTGHSFVNGIEPHILAQKINDIGIEIATVHAHDNDGKKDMHKPVGTQKINFEAFFSTLTDLKQNPYIVIEHWDNNLLAYRKLQNLI